MKDITIPRELAETLRDVCLSVDTSERIAGSACPACCCTLGYKDSEEDMPFDWHTTICTIRVGYIRLCKLLEEDNG